VVERTIAWLPPLNRLNRNRRPANDVEATIESSVTWLYIAGVKLMSQCPVAVWDPRDGTISIDSIAMVLQQRFGSDSDTNRQSEHPAQLSDLCLPL